MAVGGFLGWVMNVTTLYDTAFWGAYIEGVDDAEMIHTPLIPRVMFSGLYNLWVLEIGIFCVPDTKMRSADHSTIFQSSHV